MFESTSPRRLVARRASGVALGTVVSLAIAPLIGGSPQRAAGMAESECLARSGPVDVVNGPQLEGLRRPSVANGTIFDATTAVWAGLDDRGDPVPWTVTLRDGVTGRGSCWFGGEINGPWDDTDPDVSWEDPYHHSGGMTIELADFFIEGVRIDNQGDGIRTYGPDIRVSRAHLTDIHDDCIENDDSHALTVEDTLLDGCYSGLSARPFTDSAPDGSDNVWTVIDSLIRLEPQPTVFKGAAPGHGGFFKWDDEGRSPRLALHDTVLRADQVPNHGTLGIPDGLEFASCSNNTMVWLGDGEFPEELPDCFEVTTDEAVWDDAVAAWHRRDPDITYEGVDGPARPTRPAVRVGVEPVG